MTQIATVSTVLVHDLKRNFLSRPLPYPPCTWCCAWPASLGGWRPRSVWGVWLPSGACPPSRTHRVGGDVGLSWPGHPASPCGVPPTEDKEHRAGNSSPKGNVLALFVLVSSSFNSSTKDILLMLWSLLMRTHISIRYGRSHKGLAGDITHEQVHHQQCERGSFYGNRSLTQATGHRANKRGVSVEAHQQSGGGRRDLISSFMHVSALLKRPSQNQPPLLSQSPPILGTPQNIFCSTKYHKHPAQGNSAPTQNNNCHLQQNSLNRC